MTPHVLALQASNLRYPLKFSSHYLHKRFNIGRPAANLSARQDEGTISSADMQHSIQTLGGRVYMTTVNLSMQPYTLVIDTGSSDTWIASTTFQCVDQFALIRLQQSACGFGKLYEAQSSNTRGDIKGFDFEVRYTDGEFLHGNLTTEILELAGLVIRQVIGVVDMGWWMGDGASSGLLGLAYPGLASNSQSLNYTSVIFNL